MWESQESTITMTAPGPTSLHEECEDGSQETQPSLGRGVAVLIATPHYSVPGIVHEIRPHGLSILVRHAVPAGSEVIIEFGAVTREGAVVSCNLKGRRYELSVVIANENECERRAAERFPVTQEVQIGMRDLESPLRAMVVDLSTHGMGLETSKSLQRGEVITIESADDEAFGVVRYCRQVTNDRFQSGVEVFHIMPKNADE